MQAEVLLVLRCALKDWLQKLFQFLKVCVTNPAGLQVTVQHSLGVHLHSCRWIGALALLCG